MFRRILQAPFLNELKTKVFQKESYTAKSVHIHKIWETLSWSFPKFLTCQHCILSWPPYFIMYPHRSPGLVLDLFIFRAYHRKASKFMSMFFWRVLKYPRFMYRMRYWTPLKISLTVPSWIKWMYNKIQFCFPSKFHSTCANKFLPWHLKGEERAVPFLVRPP